MNGELLFSETFSFHLAESGERSRNGAAVVRGTMVIEFIEGDDRRIFFHSPFPFSPPLPVYLGSLGTLELFVNAARSGVIYKSR